MSSRSSKKHETMAEMKKRHADEMMKHFEKGHTSNSAWRRNRERQQKEIKEYAAKVQANKNANRGLLASGTGSRGVRALRKKMTRRKSRSGSATRGGRRRSTRKPSRR